MTPVAKPASCKVCPLFTSTEGPVWGEGPKDSDLFFVGEAPGEDEGASLRPFVGGAGRTLDAQLLHAGIDRRKVYVTNVVKCRPTARGAGGKLVNRTPTETEIRCCAGFLVGELEEVNPNVVVALGNVPLHTLTDTRKGIITMRSVPLEGPKRRGTALAENLPERFKIVPTLHPAGVMRQQHLWPAVIFDLARAKSESASPHIVRRPWKRYIHASLADHGEALEKRIREPRLYGFSYYSHDLETTGLDPKTDTFRCIGIAAEPDEVFCFDWTLNVQQFVARLHADPTLLCIGQNSENFDIPFQMAKGFKFEGRTFDTLIGWHLLNSALPKDLGFIGATVTDEPNWKDDSMYKSGEDALQNGCCIDVHATARAFEEEMKEIYHYHLEDLMWNQIQPLQPVLRSMTFNGIKKDVNRAARWHSVLTRKADEYEIKLKRGLGDASFNVDSPKQLMDLLYTRMQLPVQYAVDRTRGMRPTVDADALDALALVTNNPIFTLVRSIRTLRKWDATFVRCEMDENHYIHPHFGSAKTATGRLNSWEPNLQNWPNEVREIVVPDDKDHVILSRDWSGIEWRIAMTLAGDRVGLDAIVAGRDPHSDSYANAFGKLYEEVTKSERFEAKTINYGLLYGRSNKSLAAGRAGHPESAIPLDRVDGYTSAFFQKFKGYYDYRESIKNFVLKNHYYATAWGRRRWWYTRQQLPEAFNFPMQGNSAHMMYLALIGMHLQLPKGARLALSVHDEAVVIAHRDVVRQADECMRDVMEQEFRPIMENSRYPAIVQHYYPNGWRCPTDGNVGEDWRACKPETKDAKEAEKLLRKHLGLDAKKE